ncbi:MAG: sigma-70 family RNA polymerase sigma factor [Lawsonibacter sp.]|nr:sigma-70 family RNA polymerase sigma factor [Lawsonibacter sp.]
MLTRNAALNRARRRKEDTEELSDKIPSGERSPEQALLQKERVAALQRAIARLAQRERIIFYRKYYYQQPTAQIAAELGMTERAVEGRLYRTKKKLRDMLGGEGHDGAGL